MATFNKGDLQFILTQIRMAENGQPPVNPHLAFGLRQVDGQHNNAVPGQETTGAADQLFPRIGTPVFLAAQPNLFSNQPTAYTQTGGLVFDSEPRTISNLISDQSANNPAAVQAAQAAADALGTGYQHQYNPATPAAVDGNSLFINNVTPDAGLSAPFNTWMTLFGQFFDHGLDLVGKSAVSGTVFIPLQPDDPLYVPGGHTNFMVLTRATNQAGADGVLGTADDIHQASNSTTPFVDQNQTYTSHPSHQVFLREYALGVDGKLHATGALLDSIGADGSHHMPTWADVKANALKLGILLTDEDVNNVPLLATDAYGNFIPHPVTGMAQVVKKGADGIAGNADDVLVSGTPEAPVATSGAVRTGHAFLDDIAHGAAPSAPDAAGAHLQADANGVAGGAPPAAGYYDNEMLDAHFIAGDGRANENMGLTAVHEVFHLEHNRLAEQVKAMVRAELANGDMAFAIEWTLPHVDLSDGIQDNEWNGERIFQAAKFGTETQYQHLVFEEFARKISPGIHLFGNTDIHLDPAITAEFAHAVYRFGHSMLDQNLNRYEIGPDGTPLLDANGHPVMNNMGLIDAFLNPLAYAAGGAGSAGELVLGAVNQVGNEIDEFVTGTLRNNLLGLPLDLAAINIARGRDTGVPPINLLRNELYAQTHDTSLKPYDSWDEFGSFLKHSASLVNFVAAYGTHASVQAATTLVARREAALDLVTHGKQGAAGFSQDAYDFMHSTGAYANNKAAPAAVHAADGSVPQWSTGSVTGLDRVDLWIGGLAEKQNLFGGLLGSTFNFIFETQLEALQDADRLYYLPRIEGIHWGQEIEANTFADIIMRNVGVNHLGASIFLTPEYTIEASHVNPNDPTTWLRNPETGALLIDVLPDGTIRFLGDDNFFGNTIVLGGTAGNDRLTAGQADDDTVYGDAGNDTLDGGNGNDFLFGGAGDDVITDSAGDDVIHGDGGNDSISAGLGLDIIFGDDGDDYIDAGEGIDDVMGGQGNDVILGGEDDDELLGNEGDDWIEGGLGGDLLVGDSGAPTGQVPLFSGNDVLDGGAGGDRNLAFSGDDIMLGDGGFDKFDGGLGFDWVSYEHATHGVSVDMNLKQFIPDPAAPAGDAVRDVFIETEALSGSDYGDVLKGTDKALADPNNSLLNFELIDGLSGFFLPGTTVFSGADLILGGGGSDFIEGGGGNDVIDGDAALHVELSERMPGAQILRYITNDGHAGDIDTVVYNDIMANYTWTFGPDDYGFFTISHLVNGAVPGATGEDRVRNVERIQFADHVVQLSGHNSVPSGQPLILGDANIATAIVDVVTGSTLSVELTDLFDPDGIASPISLQWQTQDVAKGSWLDIAGATGSSFTPTSFQLGQALRVQASFADGLGYTEHVMSAVTGVVATPPAVNTAPQVVIQQTLNGLPDSSARSGVAVNLLLPLTSVFTDAQTPSSQLAYSATLANGDALGTVGLAFTLVTDATGVTGGRITGMAPLDMLGAINIRVTATDAGPGTPLSVSDTFALNVVANVITGSDQADMLLGLDGRDRISGRGGNDTLDGGLGADTLIGGLGDDHYLFGAGDVVTEAAGQGNDTVETALSSYTLGANVENLVYSGSANFTGTGNELANAISGGVGNDTLDGATGADTMRGGAGNDTYIADNAGDQVVELAGEGVDQVQTGLASFTLASYVENLRYTGSGNFIGNGNGTANTIWGGAGNDTLSGGASGDRLLGGLGNDSLDGGSGNDSMTGGAGDDTYVVDAIGDEVVEAANEGSDTVQVTRSSYTLGANLENLVYAGSGAFSGVGNIQDNDISGGSGNDTLNGMAGADTMRGGAGNDLYIVDNALDQVVELAGAGVDQVQTSLSTYQLAAFVENLRYTGSGDFTGVGNNTSNTLWGGAGHDILSGGGSTDYLYGGAGDDELDGGSGNDFFVFLANFGNDRITGFDADAAGGQDLLNVKALGITATSFASAVSITAQGADTLVQIGGDSIVLLGVDHTAIDASDFLLG
jgi:Ca2+-binding RTX toxin-like protein